MYAILVTIYNEYLTTLRFSIEVPKLLSYGKILKGSLICKRSRTLLPSASEASAAAFASAIALFFTCATAPALGGLRVAAAPANSYYGVK